MPVVLIIGSLLIWWPCPHPAVIGYVDNRSIRPTPLFLEKPRSIRGTVARIDKLATGLAELPPRLLNVLGPEAKMTHAKSRGTTILLSQFGASVTQDRHIEGAVAQIYSLGKRRVGSPLLDHIKGLLVESRGRLRVSSVQR